MKFVGSKAKISKEILPIILKNASPDRWFVEPFVGGCNIIDKVQGKRIGNDINYYLIELWRAIQSGWVPPTHVTREQYIHVRQNKGEYEPYYVGYVGYACSNSGKFFEGYANDYPETRRLKSGRLQNYQTETRDALLRQAPLLKGVLFMNDEYMNVEIPTNSIVYLDPPYANTTKYKAGDIDHTVFWDYVRYISKTNEVYISEYNAPEDFKCIWKKTSTSQLSINSMWGDNKTSTEKLFVYDKNL